MLDHSKQDGVNNNSLDEVTNYLLFVLQKITPTKTTNVYNVITH